MREQHIAAWKNKKKEINYCLIAENGETLSSVSQGFKKKQGFVKNLRCHAEFYAGALWTTPMVLVVWYESRRRKKILKQEMIQL